MLQREYLVKYWDKTPDINDRRKNVAKAVFSYIDRDTRNEYRRAFTAPAGTPENDFFDIAPKIIINL